MCLQGLPCARPRAGSVVVGDHHCTLGGRQVSPVLHVAYPGVGLTLTAPLQPGIINPILKMG